jgi:putative FmdB family regulatory protein
MKLQAAVPETGCVFDFKRIFVVIYNYATVKQGGYNVPIYEYECKKCSHRFEYMIFTSSDPEPQCPRCSFGKVHRLLSSGNVRNKPLDSGYGGFPTKKY